MEIEFLQKIMIENGLAIRAIPMTCRIVVEMRHKDEFPNGHAQYLPEFKREMWVEIRKNKHGGQFVVERNCGTNSMIKFYGKKFYKSLHDIVEDLSHE